MIVRLRALSEAVRNSLFFVPALCVSFSLALAAGMLTLDRQVELAAVPSLLRFTVESARELLTTMAGAIITVAAIVFALTGLSVQLASSQFSPRVVRGFLRDRGEQVAIGFMVGTFTYTLVVLRAVRSVEGVAVVPALSTALALALTLVTVVLIVAFVSRTAHRLQSSELIRDVCEETLDAVTRQLPLRERADSRSEKPTVERQSEPGWKMRARSTGWLAQVSTDELLDLLPPGGVARVDVAVGQFVHPGRRLCTIWGAADDQDKDERHVNRVFAVGPSRTMQQDIGFGIRQIVDIALRGLSPGVNDPTTAHECVVHLGAIMYEILRRDLPPTEIAGKEGRRVVLAAQPTYADYVEQAFDEIRQSAASLPSFAAALVQTLADLAADLAEEGVVDDVRVQPLARQAELVVAGVEQSSPLSADVLPVREAARSFRPDASEDVNRERRAPASLSDHRSWRA